MLLSCRGTARGRLSEGTFGWSPGMQSLKFEEEWLERGVCLHWKKDSISRIVMKPLVTKAT